MIYKGIVEKTYYYEIVVDAADEETAADLTAKIFELIGDKLGHVETTWRVSEVKCLKS